MTKGGEGQQTKTIISLKNAEILDNHWIKLEMRKTFIFAETNELAGREAKRVTQVRKTIKKLI